MIHVMGKTPAILSALNQRTSMLFKHGSIIIAQVFATILTFYNQHYFCFL